MQLDSFTVLASSCVALIFLGCALLYFWNLDRASKWLLWWSIPFLIGGAAALFYMQQDWATNFASIAFGNAVRITAIGLLWQGARVFERRKPLVAVVLLAPVVWLGLCLIQPFYESLPARVVGVSLLNGAFCALAAYELWRGRSEALASRAPAIVVLLSGAILMLVRIATVNILPFPIGALPLDAAWMGIFNLAVFVHAFFLGFLFMAITKERREAEQRSFAMLDPLTRLMNRRAFMSQAERYARQRKAGRQPLVLLVLDIDHFKSINDRFGHDAGDRMLAAFATVAEACVRSTDQLYRIGGEEFCFILPDTSLEEAIILAERVRQNFAIHSIEVGNVVVRATVSIGIATSEHDGGLEELLIAADDAVYEAKARGRNRVVVADPLAPRVIRDPDPYGQRLTA